MSCDGTCGVTDGTKALSSVDHLGNIARNLNKDAPSDNSESGYTPQAEAASVTYAAVATETFCVGESITVAAASDDQCHTKCSGGGVDGCDGYFDEHDTSATQVFANLTEMTARISAYFSIIIVVFRKIFWNIKYIMMYHAIKCNI